MKGIEVLFENESCLVLNKPAGLAVQGGEGVGVSLDRILEAAYRPRPLLVHRLDKDTSGVILAAKGPAAAARFSAIFAGREGVEKRYLAVCSGSPRPPRGTIRLSLEIRGRGSRESETGYCLLGACEALPGADALPWAGDFSRLELELGTGRTHQIRRHLARIGHPVLGDDKYGDFALNRALRKRVGLRRLLLHAFRLRITAALTGFPEGIDVKAPLPEHFEPFGPWGEK
ncbi:MAG: RluA family pseudouridine synthase [Treponema sp.]|jgi:23S rRNA pseudouridine955/2504/2580 synthase|nr:RluA family pseudouridine synthase [Treponema sp.]